MPLLFLRNYQMKENRIAIIPVNRKSSLTENNSAKED
jgi:hypothetical protein